jgi:lysozyme family protein
MNEPDETAAVQLARAEAMPDGHVALWARMDGTEKETTMDALFDTCLSFTLGEEGGFSDDPRDPGGATFKGITLASLRDWLHAPNTSVAVLRGLDQPTIARFYRSQFWNVCQCGLLPAGVDLMIFDHGVNAGAMGSVFLLQDLLRVDADGAIGPKTLGAVAGWRAPDLVTGLGNAQEAYYRGLGEFPIFGLGWLNRLSRRHTLATRLAAGAPPTVPAAAVAA